MYPDRCCMYVLLCLLSLISVGYGFETPEGRTLEQSPRPVAVARDGAAVASITISPAATDDIRSTAASLQSHLHEITGGDFSIVESITPAGITVGTLTQFPDASLDDAMAIRHGYDGVEAYAIRSNDGVVRLLGNTELGVSHAVYRFLELLGYRHYFMGPTWRIVPRSTTLTFDLNEVNRPAIWSRSIWFARLKTKADDSDPDRPTLYRQWARANRMAQSLDFSTRHVWHAIPNAFKGDGYPFKETFAKHPEYFALVGGERRGPQFCVTNAGLQEVVTAYARRYFDIMPDEDMVSLDPADTSGWCECDNCKALGDNSTQAFYLANHVARQLQQSHPGKYVGILAYSWHSVPPPFKLAPNVFVMLTAGMNASQLSFDQLFDLWSQRCDRLGIYEYYSYWEMDHCMLPSKGVHSALGDHPARMQRFVANNVVAISGQAALAFGSHGLPYYLAHKSMWDPHADIQRLKADFCEKAYGPAAHVMARYHERLNLSHDPLRGIVLLRACAQDLQEAHGLVQNHPGPLARINDLRANMIYNYLGAKVNEPAEPDVKKQRVLDWFVWSYRTRNNYMIDWLTFRAAVGNHEYSPTYAAQFNEPSWNYRVTEDNPWRDDTPVTAEEIDRRMAALLDEWGDAPDIAERSFSNDYVLVEIDGSGKPDRTLAFLNQATLLVAGVDGQPVRGTLHSFASEQIERQPAKLWVSTLDGKELEYRELPAGDNELSITLPGPGVYQLTVKRGGRGWKISLPKPQPVAVISRTDLDTRPQYMTGYFYVPKGTRAIGMHGQWGSAAIDLPDGTNVYKGMLDGRIVPVAVPDGMDGRVWSFTGKTRKLWFINIPTVLSADPTQMFLPREVAEADGLRVIAGN